MTEALVIIKSIFTGLLTKLIGVISLPALVAGILGLIGIPFLKAVFFALCTRILILLIDKQIKRLVLKIKEYWRRFKVWF